MTRSAQPVPFRYGYDPERGWRAECADRRLAPELEQAFTLRFPLKAWPEEQPVVGHFELFGGWGVAYKPAGRLEAEGAVLSEAAYRRWRFDPFAAAAALTAAQVPEEVPPPSSSLPEHFAAPEGTPYLPFARSLFLAAEPRRREATYWSLLPHGLSPRLSPLSRFDAGSTVELTPEQLAEGFRTGPAPTSDEAPAGSRAAAELEQVRRTLEGVKARLERAAGRAEEERSARGEADGRLRELGTRVRNLEEARDFERRVAEARAARPRSEERPGALPGGAGRPVRGALLAAALVGVIAVLGGWLYQRGEAAAAERRLLAGRLRAVEAPSAAVVAVGEEETDPAEVERGDLDRRLRAAAGEIEALREEQKTAAKALAELPELTLTVSSLKKEVEALGKRMNRWTEERRLAEKAAEVEGADADADSGSGGAGQGDARSGETETATVPRREGGVR